MPNVVLMLAVQALPGAGSAAEQPSAPPVVAVVALDASAETAAEVARVSALADSAERRLLDANAVSRRLRGVSASCEPGRGAGGPVAEPAAGAPGDRKDAPRAFAAGDASCYRAPDEAALARMLAEARTASARFRDDEALKLRREILRDFEQVPQPSARLRLIAGEAAIELAAGFYAGGKREEAEAAARDAMRHFGDTPINTAIHSPPVQKLFARARAAVSREPQVEVRVRSTEGGKLLADGNELGPLRPDGVTRLAAGGYRLWVQREDGGLSLPYAVELEGAPVEVELDPVLDARLRFPGPLELECGQHECEDLLARLRRRLGADEVVGIKQAPAGELRALRATANGPGGWAPAAGIGFAARGVTALPAAHEPPAPPPGGFWTRHRRSLLVAAGGLAVLGAGGVFGLRSRAQFADAGERGIPQLEHDALNASGRRNATTANVLFGVGALAFGAAGVMLWLEW